MIRRSLAKSSSYHTCVSPSGTIKARFLKYVRYRAVSRVNRLIPRTRACALVTIRTTPDLPSWYRLRYQDLLNDANEASLARVRASLEDLKAGRVLKCATPDELLQALEAED
ncbi:MAG: hypothetical protein V2B20_25925 [Pseudomonadota bacterium]